MQLAIGILTLSTRLVFALGCACLLLGGYLAWQSLGFTRAAGSAVAQVVSYTEIPDGGHLRYRPRLRFRTVTGEIVTFSGQLATTQRRFKIGASVPVVYPLANPPAARLASFADNWLGASLALALAAVSFAAAWLLRRGLRREAARGAA